MFIEQKYLLIASSQLQQFKYIPEGFDHKVWLEGKNLYVMIGLTLLAMIITHYLPKFTKAIPSALTAIIVVTLITLFIPLDGVHILKMK